MNARNISVLIGRPTSEPKFIKNKKNEIFQARFTIAVDRAYKNTEGETPTDFIPVRMTGINKMNVAERIHQGQGLSVTGEIRTEMYVDESNCKHYAMFLEAEAVSWTPVKRQEIEQCELPFFC